MSDAAPLSPPAAGGRPGAVATAVLAAAAVAAIGAWAGGARDAGRSAAAAAAAAVVFAGCLAGALRERATRGERVFLLVGGLALLQAIPWPASVADLLAPQAAAARAQSLGRPGASPISHDLGATSRVVLLLLLLPWLSAVLRGVAASGGAWALARGLALVLAAHAAIALRHGDYAQDDRLLGGESVGNALNAWGTFVNRAHFAGYAVVLLGPALALWRGPRPWIDRPLGLLAFALGAVAVATSGSRGGILGLFLATGTAIGCWVARRPRRAVVVGLALVVAAVATAVVLNSDTLRGRVVPDLERAFAPKPGEGKRLEVWKGTVDLALGQPVFGNGLDAFRWSYGGAGRPVPDRWVSTAESDVLQAAAEGGVVLLALLGAAAVLGLRALARDGRGASPAGRASSALALGGLVGSVPIALTSAPYHVPAVVLAATATWALARGLAAPAPPAGDASGPAILAPVRGG